MLPWWLSGGQGLDIFAGHPTRAHGDIDVSILRIDAPRLPSVLPGWDLRLAHHGTLSAWDPGDPTAPGNSIWVRRHPGQPWALQVMLEAGTRQEWWCRRHPELTVPMERAVRRTDQGVPYMAPELQLLMKAHGTRPKDDADFLAIAPLLDPVAAEWLNQALRRYYPSHPWCAHPT
jgi:hypothetical protein